MDHIEEATNNPIVLCSKISHCGRLLYLGMDKGFLVASLPKGDIIKTRNFSGGVGQIAGLGRSNIFALAGGGRFPFESRTKVIIWDEEIGKRVSTISFHESLKVSEINGLDITKDYLIVALENFLMLYKVDQKFQPFQKLNTMPNPRGVFSISVKDNETLLAYPYLKNEKDKDMGSLAILNISKPDQITHIHAHSDQIWQIEFSRTGKYIATCSRNGSLIRIWETESGRMASEIRRGYEKTNLFTMRFDDKDHWLICCNDGRAINIYDLNKKLKTDDAGDKYSPLDENWLRRFIKWVTQTESSFAYIQIKCHENDKAIITSDGTIIYFSQKGVLKKYKFDKFNGGSGGWIDPDLNILDGVTFTDDEISNQLRADRIKQKSEVVQEKSLLEIQKMYGDSILEQPELEAEGESS